MQAACLNKEYVVWESKSRFVYFWIYGRKKQSPKRKQLCAVCTVICHSEGSTSVWSTVTNRCSLPCYSADGVWATFTWGNRILPAQSLCSWTPPTKYTSKRHQRKLFAKLFRLNRTNPCSVSFFLSTQSSFLPVHASGEKHEKDQAGCWVV